MSNDTTLSSLIWLSADDILRGLFKPSEYGRVILPFVVMRRLDCVLEPKKDDVYNRYNALKVYLSNPSAELVREDATLNPPAFESTGVQEPDYDFLSDIISQVNKHYGVNLTEEDRLDLSRLSKRLSEDSDIKKHMTANNTDDNKRHSFKEKCERMMIDYVNERVDFYQKMANNPSMKTWIFDLMYKQYHTKRGQPYLSLEF